MKVVIHNGPFRDVSIGDDGRLVGAMATPSPFTSRLRPELARAVLETICEANLCGKFDAGYCHAAKCCGNKLPVATMLNLDTTHCPLNHW